MKMPLDERTKLRTKLEAQKILRQPIDVIDDRLEKLYTQEKESKGSRRETLTLLIELIEEGIVNREDKVNFGV